MIRIAVPLDGSRPAEQAIGHAVAVAKAYPAEIILLRVVTDSLADQGMPVDSVDWKLQRRQAEAYLANPERYLRAAGLNVRCVVEEGRAAQSICRFCSAEQVDLVVLSRFGAGGVTDFGTGSTARKVVARSPVSVLLVGPRSQGISLGNAVDYRHILVPVDGSLCAELAVGMAATIAQTHNADLHLVQIIQQPELPSRMALTRDLHDIVERMRRCLRLEAMRGMEAIRAQLPPRIEVHTSVLNARDVASALHAASEATDVDLIVLNAHTEDAESGWQYGSVCEALLSHTMRPVLVLQQSQAELSQRFQSVYLAEPQEDVG